MAIAHVTTGALLEESGTTHELAAPASIVDGNLLLMIAAIHVDELLTNDEGDWTKDTEFQTITSEDRTIAVWWKIASGETGTYTVSHTTSTFFKGAILQYSGVDATTPIDATVTSADAENSSTHTPASITIATDQSWVVSAITKTGGSVNATEPSGTTNRVESPGTGRYFGVADVGPESTGPFQLNNWTGMDSVADHMSITIPLRPASGAAKTIEVPTGPWR
jgi:hypothetical protein